MSNNDDDNFTGCLIIGAILVAIVFVIVKIVEWISTVLIPWIHNVVTNIVMFFGWGIGILIAVVILTWGYQRFNLTWYRWTASIAIALAIWGILSFFPCSGILVGVSSGGRLGQSITGHTDWSGVFRLLGLVIIGLTLFIAPEITKSRRRQQKQEEKRKAEIIARIDEALENIDENA